MGLALALSLGNSLSARRRTPDSLVDAAAPAGGACAGRVEYDTDDPSAPITRRLALAGGSGGLGLALALSLGNSLSARRRTPDSLAGAAAPAGLGAGFCGVEGPAGISPPDGPPGLALALSLARTAARLGDGRGREGRIEYVPDDPAG